MERINADLEEKRTESTFSFLGKYILIDRSQQPNKSSNYNIFCKNNYPKEFIL